MPLEINTLNPNQAKVLDSRSSAKRADKGGGESDSPRAAGSETVSLTGTAAKLQQIASQMAGLPQVDSDRVEAIKQAVNEGSYQVDAERVARKMIDFEREVV